MALDALGIPLDIPWKRVAWTRDMLHRKNFPAPPKWRTSLTVYAYPVPLEDTEDEYPDDRIVYLKLSASITGWTPSEAIPTSDDLIAPEEMDEWQSTGWDMIQESPVMAPYWPCLTAIAQIAILPAGEETPDDQYPYFIDFEPKKRELYEAVSETGEVLSASQDKLSLQKGNTTTSNTERNRSGELNLGIIKLGGGRSTSATTQSTELTTTDTSDERRETQGRTTQLSQLYQLFNGYHHGTNRTVFVIFARPHIVSETSQVPLNLINGQRRLEGVQEMFLVAVMPRTQTGFCVQAWIDTAHRLIPPPDGRDRRFVVTRRIVQGCADFDGDFLVPVVPETPPEEDPRMVVGEGRLDTVTQFRGKPPAEYATGGFIRQVETADALNLQQLELRQRILSIAASNMSGQSEFIYSDTFLELGHYALRGSQVPLSVLVTLEYLTTEQKDALEERGIKSSGDLFSAETDDSLIIQARDSVFGGLYSALAPPEGGGPGGEG